MEKRLPLALILSALVLFVWSVYFAPPPPPPAEEPADTGVPAMGEEAAVSPAETPEPAPAPAHPETRLGAQQEEHLELVVGASPDARGAYVARFTNRGGSLESLHFRGYYTRVGLSDEERARSENLLPLLEPVVTAEGATSSLLLATSASSVDLAPEGLDRVLWEMEPIRVGGVERGVAFTYGPGSGLVFRKRITFEPDTWRLRVELEIENRADAGGERAVEFRWLPAGCVPPELDDAFYPEPGVIAVGRGDEEAENKAAPSTDERGELPIRTEQGVLLVGVHNKYFAFLMREEGDQRTLAGARYYPVRPAPLSGDEQRKRIGVEVPVHLRVPPVGQSLTWSYLVYAGPKEQEPFVADFEAHQLVLDRDMSSGAFCGLNFTSIGNALLFVLHRFHALTGNWGMAIILLTLSVRLVLFPINRRSQTAMARYQKKMKRVQPRLDELKKKYEDDPKKQREAQAKIMQEEGAFPPLGGCLPMFLQLPVFFGLFSMLRTSFDLRQQPFYGWITDLSQPDRLARIDLELPILGTVEYFNILPILMVVMWILQQRGMPQPTDEQAARMQKMMTFMPVLFGFMLYNYAAGLSLYMLTTSTLGIFEQKVIKKVWPIDDTEVETQRKGCGPFAGVLEKVAEQQKLQARRMEEQKAQRKRQQSRRKKRH